MAGGREFDRQRFKELILFIADQSKDDPRFGATKLNKILYFADFKAFLALGSSISGATYIRMDRGPVPEEMLATLREMEDAGDISRVERKYYNYTQKVVVPLRDSAVEDLLSSAERELLEAVLSELRLLDAAQVSALSHLDHGWRIADDREVIPYESAFISDRKPTATELRIWRQDIDERRRQRAG
ncbi:MAG: Panacea domain-containing protein [Dehalococcoidia bacterium]|nr:Panacea domain-containing protein [Dehalococcoidia bacterium]